MENYFDDELSLTQETCDEVIKQIFQQLDNTIREKYYNKENFILDVFNNFKLYLTLTRFERNTLNTQYENMVNFDDKDRFIFLEYRDDFVDMDYLRTYVSSQNDKNVIFKTHVEYIYYNNGFLTIF